MRFLNNITLKLIFQVAMVLTMMGLIWIFWTAPDPIWNIGARVALTAALIALITGVILNPPSNPHDQGETR